MALDLFLQLISLYGELQDELEITSRALGQRGGYFGTVVVIRNKTTGEIIAEGRHSLFGKHYSKLQVLDPFHISVMNVDKCVSDFLCRGLTLSLSYVFNKTWTS